MVDGPMAAGRWSTVDAECVALRGCSTAPWMYRAMVGGAMVTDRCSAAWRWALSEFEEKTLSGLKWGQLSRIWMKISQNLSKLSKY